MISSGGNYIIEMENGIEATNEIFNGVLNILTPDNANSIILFLGDPSKILLDVGIRNKPIRFYGNKLLKKARKHEFLPTDLKNLPKAIANPVAVFNGNRPDSFAILTDIEIKGNNVLAIIETGKGDADANFNVITSAYAKRTDQIEKWVNAGKVLYLKEKSP